MYGFLCWSGFAPMSEISPANPEVELSFWPCIFFCWGRCFYLRLHGVHGDSHLCQLWQYRGVRGLKDCIVLCQSLQTIALCLHSLYDCLYFFYQHMVIFWREQWFTVHVLHCCGLSAFSCGYCHYFMLLVCLVGKTLYFVHVLRLADCCINSLMSSLKIPVCASRVIPFDIILASVIVYTPDLASSLHFYKCSNSRARGS